MVVAMIPPVSSYSIIFLQSIIQNILITSLMQAMAVPFYQQSYTFWTKSTQTFKILHAAYSY